MWIESLLGKEPRDALFAEAVSRLARTGDPVACQIAVFDENPATRSLDRTAGVSDTVAVASVFSGTASYGGPEAGLDFVMRQVPAASIGEVEMALRMIGFGCQSDEHNPVPSAAAGALMWFESVLGSEPGEALFIEAVSRLAQAGDTPARRIHEARERAMLACGSDHHCEGSSS